MNGWMDGWALTLKRSQRKGFVRKAAAETWYLFYTARPVTLVIGLISVSIFGYQQRKESPTNLGELTYRL